MGQENKTFTPPPRVSLRVRVTRSLLHFLLQKNKNKKKGKDEKCGSEVTTPENSSSPGMMDMHGEPPPPAAGPAPARPLGRGSARLRIVSAAGPFTFQARGGGAGQGRVLLCPGRGSMKEKNLPCPGQHAPKHEVTPPSRPTTEVSRRSSVCPVWPARFLAACSSLSLLGL